MLRRLSGLRNRGELTLSFDERYERFNDSCPEIQSLIEKHEFEEAQNILDSFGLNSSAEWHYLYAKLRFEQGWMNDAYRHYKKAYKIDPYNTVYSEAFGKIYKMKNPDVKKARFKDISVYACSTLAVCEAVQCGGCFLTSLFCASEYNECIEECSNCPG